MLARTARFVVNPASPKKTGMNRATMRPRTCSSMWLVRIGDWPIKIPAMKAPSTVWTPIALVVNAISPVITRMVVMTSSSLTKRSLAQRISRKTICRPMVKLTPRNRAVPSQALAQRPQIDRAM